MNLKQKIKKCNLYVEMLLSLPKEDLSMILSEFAEDSLEDLYETTLIIKSLDEES